MRYSPRQDYTVLPQADVIYGCYQKNHGQLRIVSNPNECLPSENPITLGSGKAGEYTGEYCWNAIVPGLDPYLMLRLSMYHLGDNNYTISGGRTRGENPPRLDTVTGSARLVENGSSLILTYMAVGPYYDTGKNSTYITSKMGAAKIDATTLNGEVAEIDVDIYPERFGASRSHIGDWYVNIEPTPCPSSK